MVRETVQHPGAVVIVPMQDESRMVFVRQYRRAIRRELLELPAGTLGAGERRIACARRELEEETGWRARQMRRIGQFYINFASRNLSPRGWRGQDGNHPGSPRTFGFVWRSRMKLGGSPWIAEGVE
jgi:8-oxo-dGTP pyrophosphatase MutT (NUDIX family)